MSSPSTTSAPWQRPSRALSSAASMLALSALCACSNLPAKSLPPQEPPKSPPPAVLPAPSPLVLESVRWRVVEVNGEALFALDDEGYGSLARNLAEATRWSQEASWQLKFYRTTRSIAPAAQETK